MIQTEGKTLEQRRSEAEINQIEALSKLPDYFSVEDRALAKNLLSNTFELQAIIEVVEWAELNGGAGKGMEIIAWLTYEYSFGAPDGELQYKVNEWINGNSWPNRPEYETHEDDGYELTFPVQTSRYEQWLALHELRERLIASFALNRQTLFDAWAWRLHHAEGEIDAMDVFSKITGEFPVEAWRYPTTDPENFQLPVGDWEPIIRDAEQWQHYRDTVHYPKIEGLRSALREYEKVIADFDKDDDEQVSCYRQYRKEWESLTGKVW